MALPTIPSDIAQYINEAATGTGLPVSVVAAQNYTESAYGTNNGPSSAGAMGPWQFEPSTWSGLTTQPFTDADNWAISTPVYVQYMSQLLKEENGNVRNALAAYNAGPGNLQAGYGYADSILALAGQSTTITAGSPGSSPAVQSAGGGGGGGIIGDIENILGLGVATTFANDLNSLLTKVMWLFNPSSWIRIGSFFVAIILLIGALIIFTKADQKITAAPVPIPVPV